MGVRHESRRLGFRARHPSVVLPLKNPLRKGVLLFLVEGSFEYRCFRTLVSNVVLGIWETDGRLLPRSLKGQGEVAQNVFLGWEAGASHGQPLPGLKCPSRD